MENNTKAAKMAKYYRITKDRQRSLLQEYYANKYKAHLLMIEMKKE